MCSTVCWPVHMRAKIPHFNYFSFVSTFNDNYFVFPVKIIPLSSTTYLSLAPHHRGHDKATEARLITEATHIKYTWSFKTNFQKV